MNSLIPCDKNCIYQKDGCCSLEYPTGINNYILNMDCAYFTPIIGIEKQIKSDIQNVKSDIKKQHG